MRSLILLVGIYMIMINQVVFSQEKAPIAINDSVYLATQIFVKVPVLDNDWGMSGHELAIFSVSQPVFGFASIEGDSIVIMISGFDGYDSINYIIKDVTNGLYSNIGKVYLVIDDPPKDYLDINNIRAIVDAKGQLFTNAGVMPFFEVPKFSGHMSFNSHTIWLGGLDEIGEDHISAVLSGLEDYYYGPVSNDYNLHVDSLWRYIWKNSRNENNYHQNHWMDPGYNIPNSIMTWPVKGDIQNGQANELAPFIDWQNDGVYNPDIGDMPAVRGDQNLYFIFNDSKDYGFYNRRRIGVEIQTQFYALDCPQDSVFWNTIFARFDIINRSDTNYFNFYAGLSLKFNLGNNQDDYAGCDTMLNCIYEYNADSFDEPSSWEYPNIGYGLNPPACGVVILNKKMSSCVIPGGISGNIGLANDYSGVYNNLQGLWDDGSVIYAPDSLYPQKFMYPGDPANNLGWNEFSLGNPPGPRYGIASLGPYNFKSGDTISLDVAYVWARDTQRDHISNLALLKERIQQLNWYYENDSLPCGGEWLRVVDMESYEHSFSVYPNPANQFVNIETEISDVIKYKVFDMMGRIVINDALNVEKQINIESLPEGIYILTIQTNSTTMTKKFIKR